MSSMSCAYTSPAGLMRGPGNFNSAKVINRWIGQKGTALPDRAMVDKCVLQPRSYNNFWTCVWYDISRAARQCIIL